MWACARSCLGRESGVRDAAEMPDLIGKEIQCRITKLDVEHEDVVVTGGSF